MGVAEPDLRLVAATMRIASEIAAARPESMLPCPACGASTKGKNLAGHVEKVHAGAPAASDGEPPSSWKGRGRLLGLPTRLTLGDDHVTLRRVLGRDRRVALPAPLLAAGLEEKKSFSHNPGSDFPTHSTWTEKAGTYVQFGEEARRSIRVGCRQGAGVRKHWDGAAPARRRRGWHVTLPGPAFVSLQYALAARGDLAPRE